LAALTSRLPAKPLERGQLALLVTLAALTVAAWVVTVHQARTMDMPMGIVARGGANPAPKEPAGASVPAEGDDMASMADMDDMAGMAGMEDMATEEAAPNDAGMVSASGMAAMGNGGWTWDGFATFAVAWAVMMAAMMFPAAAPMLLLFHKVSASRRAKGIAFVPTWVFAAGYLLVWTAIGLLTWVLVQIGSELAGRVDLADRDTWAPLALGAVLLVAGLYQFTPLKSICLRHCQSPAGFVMTHWRDGYRGALRMGIVHGAFCLGCCWAIFAVLVAAGVMSLAWMLLLTLVVFAEKVLPPSRATTRGFGTALVILGIIVGAGAVDMPWTA
jgi:predicted metal-binding membrane protein